MRPEEISREILLYGREFIEKDGNTYIKEPYSRIDSADVLYGNNFVKLKQGCELWLEGEKYPMRAFFQTDRTNAVHQFKRFIPTLLRTLNGNIFKKAIALLYFLINSEKIIDFIHEGMAVAFLGPQFYAESVFEVYKNIKNPKIRDIFCAIMQFDPAYRYRIQDMLEIIDKKEFERNPYKEIIRLWKIFRERSPGGYLTDSKGIKLQYLIWILRLNPWIMKELKEFIRNVDIEKVKLSKEDWYWCCRQYEEYHFRGIKERKEEYLKMKNG